MENQIQHACNLFELSSELFRRYSEGVMEAQNNFMNELGKAAVQSPAPAVGDLQELWGSLFSYLTDSFQRSVLFWDTIRRRGNIFLEHERAGKPPVLFYKYEMVDDGRRFERPVNYALLKIIPPEGVVTDDSKRPFIVVDPRAGHGPGIGGFRDASEIGMALNAGHPVYFVMFFPEPEPGQTILDVCSAEARFVRTVAERHPQSKKPVIYGNCQGGWAVMLLAASQPDITGPIVINGAPMSYWGGNKDKNPMRYSGGLLGGSWCSLLAGDLGNGKFDGAHLVQNFETLDPANSFWKKYYNLFANIDTEPERFLEFERWWGGYFFLNEEEIRWIVDNLFIGNKLDRGEIKSFAHHAFDLRSIQSPIIVFASMGDNITPPQQAFYWISDLYGSTEEIKANGQVIVGLMHKSIGHLGIFVSAKVARKEHMEIVQVLDYIQQLSPGLYQMSIAEKKAKGGGVEYEVSFEKRRLEDMKRLAKNDRRDEMAFEAVSEVSTMNEKLYSILARPFIRAMVNESAAMFGRAFHPLRVQHWAFSDLNPMMWPLSVMASAVKTSREKTAENNPFRKGEEEVSNLIAAALDYCRDIRDLSSEALFFQTYGGMIALGIVDPEIYREMSHKTDPRSLPLVREALSTMDKGGYAEAMFRIGALVGGQSRRIPLLRLQLSDEFMRSIPEFSHLSEKEVRRLATEQGVIVALEPERALATLPALLAQPEVSQRVRQTMEMLERFVSEKNGLELDKKQIAMFNRIKAVLAHAITGEVQPSAVRH